MILKVTNTNKRIKAMKSKILTLIVVSAIITLSFTFASVRETRVKTQNASAVPSTGVEPIGGFAFDEK